MFIHTCTCEILVIYNHIPSHYLYRHVCMYMYTTRCTCTHTSMPNYVFKYNHLFTITSRYTCILPEYMYCY